MKTQNRKRHIDPVNVPSTKHVGALHSLVIALLVILASMLMLAGPAEAQYTAHCNCKLATNQGGSVHNLNSYIKDFGTVATYHGLRLQDTSHQNQCASDCGNAAKPWVDNLADMCHSFAASGGRSGALR